MKLSDTKMSSKFFVIGFVVCVMFLSTVSAEEEDAGTLSRGMRVVSKVWQQCVDSNETFSCLKKKVLRFVDRALATDDIPLMQGLSLIRSSYGDDEARKMTDEDVENPNKVNQLLFDRLYRFMNEYSIEFNTRENGFRQLIEEGRGKLKKMAGPMLIGMMMKAGMLGLAFMVVATLAGKALMVSKIALVLASVVGLKKLFNNNEKVTYEIVKTPPAAQGFVQQGGWESNGGGGFDNGGRYRSMRVDDAQEHTQQQQPQPYMLAYRGQYPQMQHMVVPGATGTTQVLLGA